MSELTYKMLFKFVIILLVIVYGVVDADIEKNRRPEDCAAILVNNDRVDGISSKSGAYPIYPTEGTGFFCNFVVKL
jgi:hypothetical protein